MISRPRPGVPSLCTSIDPIETHPVHACASLIGRSCVGMVLGAEVSLLSFVPQILAGRAGPVEGRVKGERFVAPGHYMLCSSSFSRVACFNAGHVDSVKLHGRLSSTPTSGCVVAFPSVPPSTGSMCRPWPLVSESEDFANSLIADASALLPVDFSPPPSSLVGRMQDSPRGRVFGRCMSRVHHFLDFPLTLSFFQICDGLDALEMRCFFSVFSLHCL